MEVIKRLFKRFASTKEKEVLVENFIFLFLLQAANYILPLITLPYLVRVLGPAKFGLIAFAQAVMQCFVIFTDYGFNYSATREISIHRENIDEIKEIFNSVLSIKAVFSVFSGILLCLLLVIIPKFRADLLVYVYTFGMVLGNALFPAWFFQGMEKMKYITTLNIIGKLVFTVAVFLFIRKESDYLYVPLIASIGFLITGATGLYVAFSSFRMAFIRPGKDCLIYQLREGWHLFVSTVAVSLYTTFNVIILGFFATSAIVGYYAAAEKIIRAVQRMLAPLSQALYPYVTRLAIESRQRALFFLEKVALSVGVVTFVVSAAIFIFARLISDIVLGLQYDNSIIVLKILAFLPFIAGLSNVLGIQTMIVFNLKRDFARVLIYAGLVNLVLSLALAPFFKHVGISIAVLITEIFVTVSMFLCLLHKRLLPAENVISRFRTGE